MEVSSLTSSPPFNSYCELGLRSIAKTARYFSPNADQVAWMQRGPAQATKSNAAAWLCFHNYLAFRRPAAERVDFVFRWVVSSNGFLWADSAIVEVKWQSVIELFGYRGDWLGPMTLWKDCISSSRHTIHTETVFTCTLSQNLPWRTLKTRIQIILTSKRPSAQSESPTQFLGF
jgi:hypothetical protein